MLINYPLDELRIACFFCNGLSIHHFSHLLSVSLISAKLKLPYHSSRGKMDIPTSALHVSMRIEKSGSVRLTENDALHPAGNTSSPPRPWFVPPRAPSSPAPPPSRSNGVTASMIPSRVRWVHNLLLISSLKVMFVGLVLLPSSTLGSLSPPPPAAACFLDWMMTGRQRFRSARITALISSTDA